MIEVNLLQLIGLVVVLLTHTVTIVWAIAKSSGRISTLEKNHIIFEKKCVEIEKVLMPLRLDEMKKEQAKEAEIRRLECSKMMADAINAIRDEMGEIKTMIREHILIHKEREK
jgi:hypothetical protein